MPTRGMRDIAEAVGMRGASLYNHFHSKEEILFAIALRMTEDPQQDLLVLDGEGGPVQRLTALVEAHVRRLRGTGWNTWWRCGNCRR